MAPRDAKRALAREIVSTFHSPPAAQAAEEAFDRQFIRGEPPEEVAELPFDHGGGSVHLPALLAKAFKMSTSEARRAIAQGGVKIDGQPVDDGSLDLNAEDIDGKLLQLGKRRFVRVRLV
jgi:tyrosyl-tRNA synthetase